MGTNYYARVLPSKKRKQELLDAIEKDDFRLVTAITEKLYGRFYFYSSEECGGGEIHLGKRSGGWKFLWNPNAYVVRNGHFEEVEDRNGNKHREYVADPNTLHYIYPLTKQGIKEFIFRDDVVIYDEYGEKQNKNEFIEMAFAWDGWDAASYKEEYPRESRWICKSELIDALDNAGYQFSSITRSDFYSDRLRFSTSTDFS